MALDPREEVRPAVTGAIERARAAELLPAQGVDSSVAVRAAGGLVCKTDANPLPRGEMARGPREMPGGTAEIRGIDRGRVGVALPLDHPSSRVRATGEDGLCTGRSHLDQHGGRVVLACLLDVLESPRRDERRRSVQPV